MRNYTSSGVHHLEEIVEASLELPSVNQVELHPFCQQRPIVDWCRKQGIVVQAYSPLVRGQKWDNPVLKEVVQKYGKDNAQILIRWSLQLGLVSHSLGEALSHPPLGTLRCQSPPCQREWHPTGISTTLRLKSRIWRSCLHWINEMQAP